MSRGASIPNAGRMRPRSKPRGRGASGPGGCVLSWNSARRRFRAPRFTEIDATGAGDIFAAAFFIRLFATRDPWEAARYATLLASHSVTRVGLDGIPTQQ